MLRSININADFYGNISPGSSQSLLFFSFGGHLRQRRGSMLSIVGLDTAISIFLAVSEEVPISTHLDLDSHKYSTSLHV